MNNFTKYVSVLYLINTVHNECAWAKRAHNDWSTNISVKQYTHNDKSMLGCILDESGKWVHRRLNNYKVSLECTCRGMTQGWNYCIPFAEHKAKKYWITFCWFVPEFTQKLHNNNTFCRGDTCQMTANYTHLFFQLLLFTICLQWGQAAPAGLEWNMSV